MDVTDNIRFECCLDENDRIKIQGVSSHVECLKKGANLGKQDW